MGCTNSKQEDTPAVARCRERCSSLDRAIQHRYALAKAHVDYMQSLKLIGQSLHKFIEHDIGRFAGSVGEPPSAKLNLPPRKKGDPLEEDGPSSPKKAALSNHSRSNSGHIQLQTDSDDEVSEINSLHHSDHSSPLHSYEGGLAEYGTTADYPNYSTYPNMGQQAASFPGESMHMNYMRNKATPSVVYEHRPTSPEKGRMEFGESSSSSYYPYPSYRNDNPGPSSYPYSGDVNYGNFYNYPSYGSTSPLPSTAVASSSKPPPPPPSPPKSSPWEFLNPFESYEKFYPSYTPGRNSIDVREAEGIPELEEDYQDEVVKEVHGDQKFVGSYGYSKSPVDDEDGKVLGGTGEVETSLYETRPSVGMENDGEEHELHVVEEKVVNYEKSEEHGNGARSGLWDVSEAARDIEVQFVRASESGNEIAKRLEVGKFPYQRKHAVSSKMLHVVTPSLSVVSSSSKRGKPSSSTEDASPAILDLPEDFAKGLRNLSSTLHTLYLWEKKLYNEVKAEEKMRVIHDAKRQKLKRLDEKGAEPHKVASTQTLIRSLSTKMRIAIEIVEKLSVTINKIRDEELWPQLNELIQGLNRMWKSMLACHRNQCEAIRKAKNFGSMVSGKKLSDTHLEDMSQLEYELIDWTIRFSSWVRAQKSYVRALNDWLFKCIHYVPESTEDGIIPYSPGRLGAPPVFVICHQWSQALERISEKEVVDSMRHFIEIVYQCWEQGKRMMPNKDLERVRTLDREDQRMKKGIQALDKKLVQGFEDGNSLSVPGHVVYQSDTSGTSSGNPQGSLLRIFEAMERFTAESSKAYEELLQRTAETTVAQA